MSTTELVVFALLAVAQPQEGPREDTVRAETRAMLQSMCGDQCDVIGVRIKKRRVAPDGEFEPGFGEAPRAKLVASQIDLTLLFDSKLKKPYRDFVSERVKQRVSEMGVPVIVQQQARAFLKAPELPVEPPAPQPQTTFAPPPPAPPPAPQALPPPAPAPAQPEVDPWDRLLLRVIEFVPILLLFLILGWLIFRLMRRMEDFAFESRLPEKDARDVTLTPEVLGTDSMISNNNTTLPPPRVEDLRDDLQAFRGSTRRIYRRLLLSGDHDTVARSVALLGDFVVRDLTRDPEVRTTLSAAGKRTAEVLRSPLTEEDRQDVLRTVQAELVADRVAHRADDVRVEFEELLAWSPEAFASMLDRLDARLRVVLLRHAPQHLTESYLRGLDADTRTKAVREVLESAPGDPDELSVLGATIEADAQAALVGGYEADHMIDLIDALPAEAQESVITELSSTRPGYVRRNSGQLPVESALLHAPHHALAGAFATVALETWVDYLRGAPEKIRIRALEACPERLRETLDEELSMRVAKDPVRATAARRQIVAAVLRSTEVGLTVVQPEV